MSDYRIDVPASVLEDLRERISRTRWTSEVTGDDADWTWGTPPVVLREILHHWAERYDWPATQARWNALAQHRVPTDAGEVHVVRAGTRDATPLVLIHGWPDGFLRFEKALPLLADRFDVIIPTIPGFGFSEVPSCPGIGPTAVADAFVQVVDALGVDRFGVHGADLGSTVAERIALRHADRVIGLHLGDVPAWRRYAMDASTASADEQEFLRWMDTWFATEGAYAALHRTKPQTLAYSLDDSPAGLAAWITEKLRAWSDCEGDVLRRFSLDEICDLLTLYWVTTTAGSAARHYREGARDPAGTDSRVTVPTGFLLFSRDISLPPREYAERFFDVRRFAIADHGGHFGPWEEPAAWAGNIRAFFDELA